jgi:hypothetical protein
MAGQARFRPDATDYVAATRAAWLDSLWSRRFAVRIALIVAIATAVGTVIFAQDADFGTMVSAIAVIGAGVLAWLAAVLGLSFLLIPRRSRKLFQQQRTLARDFDVEWTDQHLAFQSDISSSTIAWPDYYKWREGRDTFLFYLNERLNHFLPKRALTPEQIIDLRNTAATFGPTRR